MRRLGSSVDWEREKRFMDEGLSNAVKEVFDVRLYRRPDLPWQTHGELGRSCAPPSLTGVETAGSKRKPCGTSAIAGRRRENRRR